MRSHVLLRATGCGDPRRHRVRCRRNHSSHLSPQSAPLHSAPWIDSIEITFPTSASPKFGLMIARLWPLDALVVAYLMASKFAHRAQSATNLEKTYCGRCQPSPSRGAPPTKRKRLLSRRQCHQCSEIQCASGRESSVAVEAEFLLHERGSPRISRRHVSVSLAR